jgi:mRNA interferase HicA
LFTIEPIGVDGAWVKQSEFMRWLAGQGATFKDGAKHIKVYLNGKQSHVPRHSTELKTGLVEGVKKQLGLK